MVTLEPENYRDVRSNPTYLGMMEMETVLQDIVQYCLLIRKGEDRSIPKELRRLALEEAKQHTRLALFGSLPGLGKTYMGRRKLKKGGLRLPPNELNPSNTSSLAFELWAYKRAGYEVAVIDDADRLMRSEPMINMMKHGWNSDEPRINCFRTREIAKNEDYLRDGSDKYSPTIPPQSYEYRLATAWFANKNISTPSGLNEFTHPDFVSLIDRGLRPRWIDSKPRNVFFYTLWMIEQGGLFRTINLNLAEAEETLAYFMFAAEELQHPAPNLRLALDLARARKNPNYQQLWKRIIADSLALSEGEPRAVTKADLKVRPDLRRAVEEARRDAAERKAAAERAVAEAREVARRAKREREEAAARYEADLAASADGGSVVVDYDAARTVRAAREAAAKSRAMHDAEATAPVIVMAPSPFLKPKPEPEPITVPIIEQKSRDRVMLEKLRARARAKAAAAESEPAEKQPEPEPPEPKQPEPAAAEPKQPEPEPHEYVKDEPTDDPYLSPARWKALRRLVRDPSDWSGRDRDGDFVISSRVKGDLQNHGWVRVVDHGEGCVTGIVTDDGEARLQLFHESFGEDGDNYPSAKPQKPLRRAAKPRR